MGQENLCDALHFTGYATDGGHAELCVAEAAYVFHLPDGCGRTLPALIHRERCFR